MATYRFNQIAVRSLSLAHLDAWILSREGTDEEPALRQLLGRCYPTPQQLEKEYQMGIKMSQVVGDSQFYRAVDVETPVLVTIRDVSEEEVGQERDKKWVVWFQESERGLVLNKINCETIIEIVGSDDSDIWIGRRIVLHKDKTDFGGKRVDCVRVRAPRGKAAEEDEQKAQQAMLDNGGSESTPF